MWSSWARGSGNSNPSTGYGEAAVKLQRDWIADPQSLPFAQHIKTHALVVLLQKGLRYHEIEQTIHQVCFLQVVHHDDIPILSPSEFSRESVIAIILDNMLFWASSGTDDGVAPGRRQRDRRRRSVASFPAHPQTWTRALDQRSSARCAHFSPTGQT